MILLLARYVWFLHEWALIPTANTVPAVNVKTKFKKSSENKISGHANGSKKLAKTPYNESVTIAYATANIQ